MKLYFENAVTAMTTLLLLILLGFIGYSVWNHANIFVLGAQKRRAAALWPCRVLLCSGERRAE